MKGVKKSELNIPGISAMYDDKHYYVFVRLDKDRKVMLQAEIDKITLTQLIEWAVMIQKKEMRYAG